MQKGKTIFVAAVILALAVLQYAHGEIIDRMVASVNGRLVTASDVRKERQVLLALGEAPPDDAAVLQTLVETLLVEEQIAEFPGIEVSDAEVSRRLQETPNLQGTPSADVRNAIARQMKQVKYFELRFRQFIQPTDEAVRKYYDEVYVPEAKRVGANPIPPLESVLELVRNNVIAEEEVRRVDEWLNDLRKRSTVEIFK